MLRAAILALAVVTLGAAVYVLGQAPETRVAAKKSSRAEVEQVRKSRGKKTRTVPKARPRPKAPTDLSHYRPELPLIAVEYPEVALDPRRVQNQDEAVEMYETFIGELANIEGSGVELSDAEKIKIYRDSSNMIAGLSEQFDPSDPDQVAYLNGARGMVLAQLRRMKIGPPESPMRKPPQMRNSFP
jgi:hypothetical protein